MNLQPLPANAQSLVSQTAQQLEEGGLYLWAAAAGGGLYLWAAAAAAHGKKEQRDAGLMARWP